MTALFHAALGGFETDGVGGQKKPHIPKTHVALTLN
jgi:hypothetical protein